MAEEFPQWSLDLLPDDPELLGTLQQLCRAWLAQGLALHPTPDGNLTYYPKQGISPLQKRLVEEMIEFKPLLLRLIQAHPALALFREEAGPPVLVCPSCLLLVPMIDGQAKAHPNQFNNKPCVGTGPRPRRRKPAREPVLVDMHDSVEFTKQFMAKPVKENAS